MQNVRMREERRYTPANKPTGCFKYFYFALVLLPLSLNWPVTFAAAEGDITLSFDAEEHFSSNFYRSETDKTGVYTTIIKPGISAGARTDWNSILFAYSPTFNLYIDDSASVDASQDNFVGHELTLVAATTSFDRFQLSLTDRFRETREPGDYDSLLNSEAEREKYAINRVSPFLTYDFAGKFTAILGYRYEVYDYEDSEDSYEHRGYFTLRYYIDDRNSLEIEEQYWQRRYPISPDYDSSQFKLIFRRELSDFLKCEIGGGYHNREFESGKTGVKDFGGFVYRLALTGESNLSRLFFSWRKNLNDISKGAAYFDAHRVTLNAEHTFIDKLTCTLGGYYQKNDYEASLRKDRIRDTYVGITYRFVDWLSAGLHYEQIERESSVNGESYSENKIYANIKFEYSTAERQWQP